MTVKTLVIALSGPNASGKSTLSCQLQDGYEQEGKTCLIIRNDEIRLIEYPYEKHLEKFPQDGYWAYVDYFIGIVAARVAENIGRKDVIIVDAGLGSADYRRIIEQAAVTNGAKIIGLRFLVSIDTCRERLLSRKGDISDATLENLEIQRKKDFGAYSGYWHEIDAEQGAAGVLQQARNIIAERFL
jgi:hypothetical protein